MLLNLIMSDYIIFCEKNYEFEEMIFCFIPFSEHNAPFIEALYYLVFYADWSDCEGNFSTFHMDMESPKSLSTVNDLVSSAFLFETHFPLFQRLEGQFQWPFSFPYESVDQFTPLQMAFHLNQILTGNRLSHYFENPLDFS